VIEELYAIGKGVVEKYGGDIGSALVERLTLMNPFLPSNVGILDTRTTKIVSVINPREDPTLANYYVIYMSGANSDPSSISPAFKADTEKNVKKAIATLLSWGKWPKEYIESLKQIEKMAKKIVEAAESYGVKYVVIAFNGKKHIEDEYVKQYILEKIKEKLMEKSVEGTCMICGRRGKVTGHALRLANFKFSTPDKEVFVPFGMNKDVAFSAQAPLCEKDALVVMVGAAFAASETAGKLRTNIYRVGNKTSYGVLVLPLPKNGREKETIEKIEDNKNPAEFIIALNDVESLIEYLPDLRGEDLDIEGLYNKLTSPIDYISAYFLEIAKSTTIIGSARYVNPNIFAHLLKSRRVAEDSLRGRTGKVKIYSPLGFTTRKSLFYDFIALQIIKEKEKEPNSKKISEKDTSVAIKQAIDYYVLGLGGNWEKAREWLKWLIPRGVSRILLQGEDIIPYAYRGVVAVLTVESMINGEIMSLEKMLDVIKSYPDRYVAFLAGLLSAEAMYLQREEKGLSVGEEPFRKTVGNAAIGDLEDFKRILVLAVDKINQYGGTPSQALEGLPLDIPELLNVRKTSKTEDIRFAFVLGLLLGEVKFNKKEGGGKDGEKA